MSVVGARARRLDVLLALVRADLRSRYGRGRLRFLKWLLDPLFLVGVYLLLVAILLRRGGPAPGLSLACAVVPFQLVMGGMLAGLDAIASRSTMLLNFSLPRGLLPLASALTETVAFSSSLLLLALMMAIYGIPPTPALLWLPVIVVVNLLLAAAAAYPAALVGLLFREFRPFAVSIIRTAFFLSPGLVALDQITGVARELIVLNPLTGLFEAYRAVLLYGTSPAAWQVAWPIGAAGLVAAIFVPLYRREQSEFAKVL